MVGKDRTQKPVGSSNSWPSCTETAPHTYDRHAQRQLNPPEPPACTHIGATKHPESKSLHVRCTLCCCPALPWGVAGPSVPTSTAQPPHLQGGDLILQWQAAVHVIGRLQQRLEFGLILREHDVARGRQPQQHPAATHGQAHTQTHRENGRSAPLRPAEAAGGRLLTARGL